MKLKKILFLIFFSVFLLSARNFTWTIDYGNNVLRVRDIQKTQDGGMVIAGYAYTPPGLVSAFVIKFDAWDNIEWAKTMGSSDADYGEKIVQLPTGEYILMGYTEGWGNGVVMLAKLDTNGDLIWFRVLGPASSGSPWMLLLLSDGVVVAGDASAPNSAFAAKVDFDGNLVWMKSYSYDGLIESFFGGTVTYDGNIVLCGYLDGAPFGGWNDLWIMKINSFNGDVIWCKIMGTAGTDDAYSVVEDSEHNLLVCGFSNYPGGADFLQIKLDANGNILWANKIGRSGIGEGGLVGRTSLLTPDNGHVMLGRGDYGSDTVNIVIKINSDGTIGWSKRIGTSNDFIAGGSVTLDSDGDILLAFQQIPPMSIVLVAGFPIADGDNCNSYDLPMSVTSWNYGSMDFTPEVESFTNISAEAISVLTFQPIVDTVCMEVNVTERRMEQEKRFLETLPGRIILNLDRKSFVRISLYDFSGKRRRILYKGFMDEGRYTFNLKDLPAGVYPVVLESPFKREVVKVIVK